MTLQGGVGFGSSPTKVSTSMAAAADPIIAAPAFGPWLLPVGLPGLDASGLGIGLPGVRPADSIVASMCKLSCGRGVVVMSQQAIPSLK